MFMIILLTYINKSLRILTVLKRLIVKIMVRKYPKIERIKLSLNKIVNSEKKRFGKEITSVINLFCKSNDCFSKLKKTFEQSKEPYEIEKVLII